MSHRASESTTEKSGFDLTVGLRAVNRAVQIINRGRDPANDLREAVQAVAAGLDYDYFGYASLTERSGGMIELGSGNSVVMRGSNQVTDFSFLAGTSYPYREVGFEWLRTLVEEKIYSGVMSDLPKLIVDTLDVINCKPNTYVLVPLSSDNRLMGALAIGCDDGSYEWEENELLVIESFAAALAGILSAGREKKLREAALNTTPDVVAVVTAHSGQLRFVNKRQFIGVSLMDEVRIPIMECFNDYISQEDKRAMARAFRPLFKRDSGDLEVEYTFTAKLPNGSTHHLFTRGRALDRWEDGIIETYLLTVQDVTEDIRMRTQLKKEQERYASFIRYSQEGIYYVAMNKPVPLVDLPNRDIDWMYNNSHLADCNQAMADLMGGTIHELIGMPTAMIHPIEDRYNRDRFAKILDSNNLTLSQVESVMEVRGEKRHVVSNVVAIVDDRHLIGVWGTLRDVTEQRMTEDKLLERDMLLQTVITQAEINVWDWYPASGEIIFLNDWDREIFGVFPQKVNFNAFYDRVQLEDRNLLMNPYLQAHADPEIRFYKAEFRLRHLDGSYRWTQHRGHIISRTQSGLPLRVAGVQVDVHDRKSAELQVRENEQILRELFERGPLGVYYVNNEFKIFSPNRQFGEMLKLDVNDIAGREAYGFIHPDDSKATEQVINLAFSQQKDFITAETRFVGGDRSIIYARISVSFIRNEDGSSDRGIVFVEDLTQIKSAQLELTRQSELLRTSLNTIPDIKWRISHRGELLDTYTPEGSAFFRVPKATPVISKKLTELLPPVVWMAIQHNIEKALHRPSSTISLRFNYGRSENGKPCWFEGRIRYLRPGEVMMIVRDISELESARRELEEKIAEANQKTRRLEQYIQSNRQLENFAYIASHDLKQPLRNVSNFAGFLAEEEADKLSKKGKKYLSFIKNGADDMRDLIDDLLQFSRIESSPATFELVALLTIMTAVFRQTEDELHAVGGHLIVSPDLPETVAGSRLRLTRLFYNLVSNAVKFRHPDRPPVIEISGWEDESHTHFRVADNGIGIKRENQEIIFELFRRIHGTQEQRGNGIGLSVVQSIVKQQGGEVSVESEVGAGTVFHFSLSKGSEVRKEVNAPLVM